MLVLAVRAFAEPTIAELQCHKEAIEAKIQRDQKNVVYSFNTVLRP
jgi:hypothetical protein